MNNQNLQDIEYLRQRANITYEEAATLLEHNDGSVIRVLMVLEQQGRLYSQPQETTPPDNKPEDWKHDAQEAGEKAKTFARKIFNSRLVIEKSKANEKSTVVNLSMPLAIGAAIIAPYMAVISAAAAAVTGCSIKVEEKQDND